MTIADVIIIGSGIAALTAADRLSVDKDVIIFTKSELTASNSYHAQGGVAAAIHPDDHWENHYLDTEAAGGFHNDLGNTKALIQHGSGYISRLIDMGMDFDRNPAGQLNFAREGGHLTRRILHAGGDATGKALITFMLKRLKDKVTIVEDEMAMDLLIRDEQCIGVTTKNTDGLVFQYVAATTIVATGGCGGLYTYTSNDYTVTGDGIAMAYRAGAVLSDLEFVQFHPTLLYKDGKSLGLISEAVRGEGALLINSKDELIMKDVHELKDLAPRDVVARTIFTEIQNGQEVFLDITNVKKFARRFPTIHQLCVKNDIEPDVQLLPVIPGAHFMMGGIKADKSGRTSIKGLYAIGEVACTGVHGANRIASNSLLEGIVFGNLTADAILTEQIEPVEWNEMNIKQTCTAGNLPTKEEVQIRMTKHVGVVRNKQDLNTMKYWLEQYDFLQMNLSSLTKECVEIINMLTVAWLITTSALVREESKGSHFRSDFPMTGKHSVRNEILRCVSEQLSIST